MTDHHDGYDDDSDAISVDSDDDDVVEFVASKKRKFAYTTFGNEDQEEQPENGHDVATYGVFLDSDNDEDDRFTTRRHSHYVNKKKDGPSTMSFVKSKTTDNFEKEEEKTKFNDLKQEDVPVVQESKTSKELEEEGTQKKEEEEQKRLLKEEKESANARFMELLGRGKQKGGITSRKRPLARTAHSESAPGNNDMVPPIGGLGFEPSSQQRNEYADQEQFGMSQMGLGMTSNMAASFGLGNEGGFVAEKPKIDPNLGKWEKHTKGIGMKLLTKMGYKGSGGLGSNRRPVKKKEGKAEDPQDKAPMPVDAKARKGISRPVEVVVRPNNLGLGYGNFKEATKLKVNQQIEAEVRGIELPKKSKKQDMDNHMAMPFSASALPSTQELLAQESWRKSGQHSRRQAKRPKRNIVSATQVLESQQHKPVIIDMRGPSLSISTDGSTKEVPLAEELLHNVTLILNTYENKLHSTSHFVQSTKRKVQSIVSDITDIKRRKREGQERIDKTQTVLSIMDQIDNLQKNGDPAVAVKVQSLVKQLSGTFTQEEKVSLNFYTALAPSLFSSLLERRFSGWDPLKDSSGTSEAFIHFIVTLDTNSSESSSPGDEKNAMAMRQALFRNHVIPRVKKALQSVKWDPISNVERPLALYEAMIRAATMLSPTPKYEQDERHVLMTTGDHDMDGSDLPNLVQVVQDELVHDTIYPKLSRCVSQWKPQLLDDGNGATHGGTHLQDRIDLWVLPWVQHLDYNRSILPSLVSEIKRKIKSAMSFLQRKVSNDDDFLQNSVETLKPWKLVFKSATLYDLTSTYVTPRLARCLSNLKLWTSEIITKGDELVPVCVLLGLSRLGLISDIEFLSLVEGELLQNWAKTLYTWILTSSNKKDLDMKSVVEYYLEWKLNLFFDSRNDNMKSGKEGCQPWTLLHKDSRICRIFYGGLLMIQAVQQPDSSDVAQDAFYNLRPKSGVNYRVVLARRHKEKQLMAQVELNQAERMAHQDQRGFASTSVYKKEESSTFRDVVQDYAREQDLDFLPRMGANALKDGKQVFLFGSLPIYLDSNVVFAFSGAKWKPVSLEQLGSMAKAIAFPS